MGPAAISKQTNDTGARPQTVFSKRAFERHLGDNLKTSQKHLVSQEQLGGVSKTSGRHQASGEASGKHLRAMRHLGRHLEGIWEASGRHLEASESHEASGETSGRHL